MSGGEVRISRRDDQVMHLPCGHGPVPNLILTADLDDWARADELNEWLDEHASARWGAGRDVDTDTLTWRIRNLADVGAVVRHAERMPWAHPEFLQLLIKDQEEVFFRLWMFRGGRLVEMTPPERSVQEEVWPSALNGIRGDLYLRTALPDDADLLAEMLVEAINWPADRAWPKEQILGDPRNARYVSDWQRDTDFGVIAVGGPAPGEFTADDDDPGSPFGAAWVRYLPADDPGYGFVDAETPELTMAMRRPWRGRGIGRALLRRLLSDAAERGIGRISLSVEPGNRAQELYASEGFVVVGTDAAGSLTMLREEH